MDMVTIKFYSLLRKAAGTGEYQSEASSVKEAVAEVKKKYGAAADRHLGSCAIMVNGQNVENLKGKRTRLQDGDEVSFYPRIAGG